MNSTASIAAVIGLSIQPMQAFVQSEYVVIEHAICGQDGTQRGLTRVAPDEQNPFRHDPSQTTGCAHALRPNGPSRGR